MSLTAPRHPRTAVSVATATALAWTEMFLGDGHPINDQSCTKERPIPSSDREQPQPSMSVRVLGSLAICHHQFSEWELGSTSHFNFNISPVFLATIFFAVKIFWEQRCRGVQWRFSMLYTWENLRDVLRLPILKSAGSWQLSKNRQKHHSHERAKGSSCTDHHRLPLCQMHSEMRHLKELNSQGWGAYCCYWHWSVFFKSLT